MPSRRDEFERLLPKIVLSALRLCRCRRQLEARQSRVSYRARGRAVIDRDGPRSLFLSSRR
jgi:hypothetical protein